MLVSGLRIRKKARRTPVLGGGGPVGNRADWTSVRTNILADLLCIRSHRSAALINVIVIQDKSPQTGGRRATTLTLSSWAPEGPLSRLTRAEWACAGRLPVEIVIGELSVGVLWRDELVEHDTERTLFVRGQGIEQVPADRCSVDGSGQRDELAPLVGNDDLDAVPRLTPSDQTPLLHAGDVMRQPASVITHRFGEVVLAHRPTPVLDNPSQNPEVWVREPRLGADLFNDASTKELRGSLPTPPQGGLVLAEQCHLDTVARFSSFLLSCQQHGDRVLT